MDKIKKIFNKDNIKIIILIVFILALSFVLFLKETKTNEVKDNTVNVEIKKTKGTTVKSDGVYITDVSDVVDEAMPSIVAITSKTIISTGRFGPSFYGSKDYKTEGAGSGVIVADSNDAIYILTNYHVVEDSSELSVKFIDDKSYDAKVLGVSERKDIAIVSVSKKDMDSTTLSQIKIATLGSSDELKVGQGVIAIGNALGYGQSVTTGVVSALNREVETDEYVQNMIQIDAAINGGNSGGALLNSKGEVIGINTAKYSSSGTSTSVEGMGFAIPISSVEDLIKTLISGEDDNSAVSLGIEGYMTTSNTFNYNMPEGFYISKITSGSNADKSELEIGNIITQIDSTDVSSVSELKKIINSKNKGDKITLKVKYISRSEYKDKEIEITLE